MRQSRFARRRRTTRASPFLPLTFSSSSSSWMFSSSKMFLIASWTGQMTKNGVNVQSKAGDQEWWECKGKWPIGRLHRCGRQSHLLTLMRRTTDKKRKEYQSADEVEKRRKKERKVDAGIDADEESETKRQKETDDTKTERQPR